MPTRRTGRAHPHGRRQGSDEPTRGFPWADSSLARISARAQNAPQRRRRGVSDWYAFTLSFKGVVLEGLEVAFILLTFGANQHNIGLAALAALAAVVVVVLAGVLVRAPLAQVPENTMKFVVG